MSATAAEETRVVSNDFQGCICAPTSPWGLPPTLTAQAMVQVTAQVAAPNIIVISIAAPRDTFNELVAKWRRDTDHISSITKTVMHPCYQTIMAMGRPAVPLILEELRDRGGHWFWALRFITQQNPADGCVEFDAARGAWLEWGRRESYIS